MKSSANSNKREKTMAIIILLFAVLLLLMTVLYLNCVKQIKHLEEHVKECNALIEKEIRETLPNADGSASTEVTMATETEELVLEETSASEELETIPTVSATHSTEAPSVQPNIPERTEPQAPSIPKGDKEENEGNEDLFE